MLLLSLVYLCMVLTLYHYLWKSYSLEQGFSFLESTQHGPRPQISPQISNQDSRVLFNFKRRNGFFEDINSTNATVKTNNSLLHNSTHLNSWSLQNSSTPHNRTRMFSVSEFAPPSNCVHAFYYMWYGEPGFDRKYFHWNHHYLPHWEAKVTKRYPQGRHLPPEDIGASFYPELGCYSSRNPAVIEAHMYQLRKAGVGVVSVSWYPNLDADDEGFPPDPLLPLLLDIAQMYSIKVTVHIEPYKGRSALSLRNDLRYIIEKYSSHPAFYKHHTNIEGVDRKRWEPLIYVYDSYITQPREWAMVLKVGGAHSIRGTELDCIVIGLLVERAHQQAIVDGGFDGFYTYFAANGFSYGSSTVNWRSLADFAKKKGLIFIPSFGPGYDDVRVRPWNQKTTKPRNNGQYYRDMFQAATRARVGAHTMGGGEKERGLVSLTSFNEWHEGSQIETAVPKSIDGFTYVDYSPYKPDFYLKLTNEIASNMPCNL